MKTLIACVVLAGCAVGATVPARQRKARPVVNSAAAEAAAKKRYIGLRYGKTLPAGHESLAAWLLPTGEGGAPEPEGLGVNVVGRGRTTLLWLERVTRRAGAAGASSQRQVLDAVVMPAFNRDKALVAFPCYVGERFDPDLVGLVDYDGQEFFTRVRRAWRVNRLTNKLEDVPTTNLKCQNEGYTS